MLRVIAGLWPAEGGLKAPAVGRAGLCFLTQRPYMCPGSIRQNIAYPSQDHLSDSDIQRLLSMAGLSDLFDRLANFDEVLDWANILSLGEQQRVAFARCFHMMPSVAVLDESTSALDPENEEMLYQTMRSLKMHFISVGHRSQLKAFHDQLLVFDGKGRFASSQLQAVPIPPPQSHEPLQPSALSKDAAPAQTELGSPEASTSLLPLLRLCFLQRDSFKNLFLHFIILLLTVLNFFLGSVWVQGVVIAGAAFTNTSLNFFFQYLLLGVLAPTALDTIINACIAYVALRTRKNVCRNMHSRYFSGNTYACTHCFSRTLRRTPQVTHSPPSLSPLSSQLLQVEHVIRRHGRRLQRHRQRLRKVHFTAAKRHLAAHQPHISRDCKLGRILHQALGFSRGRRVRHCDHVLCGHGAAAR